MNTEPNHYHRRSIRLQAYDYPQAGAYYVTIVTYHRECSFGKVVNGVMQLNDVGCIAEQCWQAIPKHHTRAELDEFVIMPNHVHGVIVIMDHDGVVVSGAARDPSNPFSVMSSYRDTVSVVVRTYKAAVTTLCRSVNRSDFGWQRNYYEHMIRSQDDLNRIREYILNNPVNWESDKENSDEFRKGFCTHESARAQSPADPPPPQPVTRGTICFPHNPKIDFK